MFSVTKFVSYSKFNLLFTIYALQDKVVLHLSTMLCRHIGGGWKCSPTHSKFLCLLLIMYKLVPNFNFPTK